MDNESMEILKSKSVLFVENNEEFAQNFMTLLELFVHKIWHCKDLTSANHTFQAEKIDIIISDIKLNHENGLSFIESIRRVDVHIPIIVLSGNKNEEFLFRAIPLNLCAYLLKPIKYKDFIESLEKCACSFTKSNSMLLKNGCIFDHQKHIFYLQDGTCVELHKKESAFIKLLIENGSSIVTKDRMLEAIWNYEDISEGAIANFIMRLRKKVGKNLIYTVPEIGYKLGL